MAVAETQNDADSVSDVCEQPSVVELAARLVQLYRDDNRRNSLFGRHASACFTDGVPAPKMAKEQAT